MLHLCNAFACLPCRQDGLHWHRPASARSQDAMEVYKASYARRYTKTLDGDRISHTSNMRSNLERAGSPGHMLSTCHPRLINCSKLSKDFFLLYKSHACTSSHVFHLAPTCVRKATNQSLVIPGGPGISFNIYNAQRSWFLVSDKGADLGVII